MCKYVDDILAYIVLFSRNFTVETKLHYNTIHYLDFNHTKCIIIKNNKIYHV